MTGHLGCRLPFDLRQLEQDAPCGYNSAALGKKELSMSLVSCRACGHQVDTSALACPRCCATDPGHKFSRQQRNLVVGLIQAIVIVIVLSWGGLTLWRAAVPLIKDILGRPSSEQSADNPR